MTVRPATTDDYQVASSLLSRAGLVGLDASAQFGPLYAVALDVEQRVIGLAGLELYGSDALLRSVVVEYEEQGQGLGKQLAEDRIKWAANNGIRTLYLLTTTARDYWKRFGFEEFDRSTVPIAVSKSHEWSAACPAIATAMRRDL